MEEYTTFHQIKPCSVSLQRLSLYYGESKCKSIFEKAKKKTKIAVAPKAVSNKSNKSIIQKEKKHICNICDYAYPTTQLKNHIATVHEGQMPNKCSDCKVAYSNWQSLDRHIKLVHEG